MITLDTIRRNGELKVLGRNTAVQAMLWKSRRAGAKRRLSSLRRQKLSAFITEFVIFVRYPYANPYVQRVYGVAARLLG